MKIPESIRSELSQWDNGKGIELGTWISAMGDFKRAVGYTEVFWPRFVLFEDYILREGFSVESLRGFEQQQNRNKQAIEWVMNHLHIGDIHYGDMENASEDKVVYLGNTLKEIYECKLRSQFPDRPCVVELLEPSDRNNLLEFQLSFWQKKHEK